MSKRGITDFDQEVSSREQPQETGQNAELADELQQNYTDQARAAFDKTKQGAKKTKELLNKRKGIDSGGAGLKKASPTEALKNKATGAVKGLGKKGAGAAKKLGTQATKAAGRLLGAGLKKLGLMLVKLGLPYLIGTVVALVAVAGVSVLAASVIDTEYSRTNEANYQHRNVEDGNYVQNYATGSQGNVFFNPKTQRYELAKGSLPTQANRLHYVYYAVMANQAKWFVEYERTDVTPDDPGAGTKDKPYWKPIKRDSPYDKYTLDGYLFSGTVLDKVGLRKLKPDQSLTIEQLVDESAVESINKLTINTNLLYLLNSTMNGGYLGTAKDQLYFSEQFVKPTHHDEHYNFKALTEYREMTAEEKAKYAAKAHGGSDDGELETAFQNKYKAWSKLLDAQNEARGGNNQLLTLGGNGDGRNGRVDSNSVSGAGGNADGINNEVLKRAVEWGLTKVGKAKYSMDAALRLGPDYYDCSSFVMSALKEAGLDVPIMNTVGMLQASNALGQNGTLFRQVDLNTAKKGTIIVTGGLAGGGAAGHTFFLLEDYHGPDTKVLESNYGLGGVASHNSFQYAAVNGTPIALEPTGSSSGGSSSGGGSSSSSSSSSGGEKVSRVNAGSQDLSQTTPNTYQDKLSTGRLIAESYEFNSEHSPSVIDSIHTKESLAYPVWRQDDFFIGKNAKEASLIKDFDPLKLARATGNSDFKAGYGALTNAEGQAVLTDESEQYVLPGVYREDRDVIVQWSLANGYNPAFLVALIKELSLDGNADFYGNRYNFLNDKDVLSNKYNGTKTNTTTPSSTTTPSEGKKKDDSSINTQYNPERPDTDPNYGAEHYAWVSSVGSIEEGLKALTTAFMKDNPSGEFNQETAKRIQLDEDKLDDVMTAFAKAGGQQRGLSPLVLSNADELKGVTVYTWSGEGYSDRNGLGNVIIEAELDKDTKLGESKQLKYYEKESFVKQHDAVSASISTKAYKQNGNKPATVKGVWNHGFGTIFKVAKLTYEAWEVGIDKKGNYYLATDTNGNWFTRLINAPRTLAEDTQYQVLGSTTPFGTLNVGNEVAESQYRIEKVIDKLKAKQELTAEDKAILLKHKEDSRSLQVNGQVMTVHGANFIVTTKPILEKEPKLTDSNGGQYLIDYLQNYVTYVPNTAEADLDVIARWKALADANATTQDAANRIVDLFNKTFLGPGSSGGNSSNGSNKSSSSSSSGGSSGGSSSGKRGPGGGFTEQSLQAAKKLYDKLVAGGMGSKGAVAVLAVLSFESSFDPTATYGELQSPFEVSAIDQANLQGSAPIGIAQWNGERKAKLLRFAKEKGTEWSDLDTQVEFLVSGEGDQGLRDVLAKTAKTAETDLQAAAKGYFMASGIHGGIISFFDVDPATDSDAMKNAPEAHYNQELLDFLSKELITDEKAPDLDKLGAGAGVTGGGYSGSGGGTKGKSASAVNVALSNWGDGTSLSYVINNFLSSMKDTILGLFSDGNGSFDPTLWSNERITNDKPRYKLDENKKVIETFPADSLIINGADGYRWTRHEKGLSYENAEQVLRQFVATLESRDNRPVYYDQLWDTFNSYDLHRIVEENYKEAFKGLFKQKPKQNKHSKNKKARITAGPFSGSSIKDSTVSAVFGFVKKGGTVEFNPFYTFDGSPNEDVKALEAGTVVYSGDSEFGKTVIVRTNSGDQLVYTGLSKATVDTNDSILAGDSIGKAGSDGRVSIGYLSQGTDASNGLPPVPSNDAINTSNPYLDPGKLFGITGDKAAELQKAVNGFDSTKGSVPSADQFSQGSPTKLGDFIKSGGGAGGWVVPIGGNVTVTSPFGVVRGGGINDVHNGIDFVNGDPQTPIMAANTGVVVHDTLDNAGAELIILQHEDNLFSWYAHMTRGSITVKKGDTVESGEEMALMGSTGNSTGPHLHLAITTQQYSGFIDPADYVPVP